MQDISQNEVVIAVPNQNKVLESQSIKASLAALYGCDSDEVGLTAHDFYNGDIRVYYNLADDYLKISNAKHFRKFMNLLYVEGNVALVGFPKLGNIDLSYITIKGKLEMEILYALNLKLPRVSEEINLPNLTWAENLIFSTDAIENINMPKLMHAYAVTLPQNIGGNLNVPKWLEDKRLKLIIK